MDQSFGGLLKSLRAEKRMGVRELGRAVGISAMHISNLEKGKSMPSAELVEKLAAELEGDLDQLLHLADQIDHLAIQEVFGCLVDAQHNCIGFISNKLYLLYIQNRRIVNPHWSIPSGTGRQSTMQS